MSRKLEAKQSSAPRITTCTTLTIISGGGGGIVASAIDIHAMAAAKATIMAKRFMGFLPR
jgi:hypothetical protein